MDDIQLSACFGHVGGEASPHVAVVGLQDLGSGLSEDFFVGVLNRADVVISGAHGPLLGLLQATGIGTLCLLAKTNVLRLLAGGLESRRRNLPLWRRFQVRLKKMGL